MFLLMTCLTGMICLTGCAEQRLRSAAIIDDAWDENLNQEAKEIAVTGQTYPGHSSPGIISDSEDGMLFFNKRKPQIKTKTAKANLTKQN